MKYIIMCGGTYKDFKTPKQLLKVNGEVLVERTIRLLKENGITDIAISTNNPAFDYLDVPIYHHNNKFISCGKQETKKSEFSWLNAYYPTDEPCCYLHGDVYFSDEAIQKIINTEVEDNSNEILMTYEVTAQDLENFERTKDYNPGKANPFAAYSPTVVAVCLLYDSHSQ